MRIRIVALLSATLVCASTLGISADVKSQQRHQVKLEGLAGSVAGMFGGKAAKEGPASTIALKGDRMMSTTETTGELIDLNAEKVYHLDLRSKTYTVQTFAELRAAFEKAMAKGRSDAADQKTSASEKPDGKQPEMTFDVDVKKTGQQKSIAGFQCDQVIVTLTVYEKGKTIDTAGGMIVTTDLWMTPKNPGLQEHAAFQAKYAQKLYGDQGLPSALDLTQAMAAYPGLSAALARSQSEGRKLDGTPLLTTVTVASVPGPGGADTRAEPDRGADNRLAGALGGLLGRKKKADPPADGAAPEAGGKTRTTIMTIITEVLSIESAVAAADVEIPAGFKQK
jgi:hypothetical protein